MLSGVDGKRRGLIALFVVDDRIVIVLRNPIGDALIKIYRPTIGRSHQSAPCAGCVPPVCPDVSVWCVIWGYYSHGRREACDLARELFLLQCPVAPAACWLRSSRRHSDWRPDRREWASSLPAEGRGATREASLLARLAHPRRAGPVCVVSSLDAVESAGGLTQRGRRAQPAGGPAFAWPPPRLPPPRTRSPPPSMLQQRAARRSPPNSSAVLGSASRLRRRATASAPKPSRLQ